MSSCYWDGVDCSDIEMVNFRLMNDEYVWLQYTGLKDENEKEVYEGDIIKICANLLGKIEFNNEVSAFVVRHINYIGYRYLGKWIADYEVIGNIYENPELLK